MTAEPEIVVAPRYKLASEALRAVATKLRADLRAHRAVRFPEPFDVLRDLSRHMGCVVDGLTRLDRCIEQFKIEVLNNETASAIDIGRSAGQLGEALQTFVSGYQLVRASSASTEFESFSKKGRRLMMGVYRHYLNQVLKWMGRLTAALDDPIRLARDTLQSLDSDVTLNINLQLTTPLQFKRLNDIANQIVADLAARKSRLIFDDEPSPPAPIHRTPGLLAHLGALAFGIAVA